MNGNGTAKKIWTIAIGTVIVAILTGAGGAIWGHEVRVSVAEGKLSELECHISRRLDKIEDGMKHIPPKWFEKRVDRMEMMLQQILNWQLDHTEKHGAGK